jgi:hypothetical protein
MSDIEPPDDADELEEPLTWCARLDQINSYGQSLMRSRASERKALEAFCETLKRPFEILAEKYGYAFSQDAPSFVFADGKSFGNLVITLQHKEQPGDVRVMDVAIANLRTRHAIIFEGRDRYEDMQVLIENTGSLAYIMKKPDFTKRINQTAEIALASLLRDTLQEEIETEMDGGQTARLRILTVEPNTAQP